MKKKRTYKKIAAVLLTVTALSSAAFPIQADAAGKRTALENEMKEKGFVLIKGGSCRMGSPKKENWRTADEKRHTVAVDDFYMSAYEVSQAEYRDVMGRNPSSFSGRKLPVESVSWLDAVRYCNARSRKEGLTPVYNISGNTVSWRRSADGYRLPTAGDEAGNIQGKNRQS